MRIVVDTNVIVSALVFGGLPRRVFEIVEGGLCEFYYSAEIEGETRRVLRDKFGWDQLRVSGERVLRDGHEYLIVKTELSNVGLARVELVNEGCATRVYADDRLEATE